MTIDEEARKALTEARAYLKQQGKRAEGVGNQWKLAEWLHDFEADVDSDGVILRSWEEQTQKTKDAYYQCADDCIGFITTSQQEAGE